jgi:hypothetical protein
LTTNGCAVAGDQASIPGRSPVTTTGRSRFTTTIVVAEILFQVYAHKKKNTKFKFQITGF